MTGNKQRARVGGSLQLRGPQHFQAQRLGFPLRRVQLAGHALSNNSQHAIDGVLISATGGGNLFRRSKT
jgi:hypothetical protein